MLNTAKFAPPPPLVQGMEGGSLLMVVGVVSGVKELFPDHSAWSDRGTGGGQWLWQVHHCQADPETL